MRRNFAVLAVALVASAARLGAVTFVVTNTNDSGAGSLRQAIIDSDTTPGANEIDFAIPGTGVQTIHLLSPLPTITVPVYLDGYTQPGASPNTNPPGQGFNSVLLIEIDGSGAGALAPCLSIGIGNSSLLQMEVQGLVLNRCPGIAIGVYPGGSGAVISGNFLGTDPSGTVGEGGSGSTGIEVDGASGVVIVGNLISGNAAGILLRADAAVVGGNLLGTSASGTEYILNSLYDIDVNSGSGNTIGGSTPDVRNVISGADTGILEDVGAASTKIIGNFIGTDITGTRVLGWGANGAFLAGANSSMTGNVVAGWGNGVFLSGTGSILKGNFIGTDATASLALHNVSTGIVCQALGATIGGTHAGEGNVIAYNGIPGYADDVGGVEVRSQSQGVSIRGNSVFDNFPLGIDLPDSGALGVVTPDDICDGDTGGNGLQNYPIITAVVPGATTTHVEGYLSSKALSAYQVDLFAGPLCLPRPQTYLQGETYLGTLVMATDTNCSGAFSTDVPVVLLPGQPVTATATDANGNTSEFSQRSVLSIEPRSGVSGGGTVATVHGMLFDSASTVTIGGVAASTVTWTDQYTMTATMPQLPPGSVNDVTVAGPTLSGTLKSGWVADFLDVPQGQLFHDFVVTIVADGIAAGVGAGNYGVDSPTLRQQMAVFLLKSEHGLCYTPPPCTGIFSDVPCPSTFADWIEALAGEGITGGCGAGNYCPQNSVRRDQMAAFLLKAEFGSSYVPPACTGAFADVACPSLFADWIEVLYGLGVTGGCGTNPLIYCPANPVTRGQMAVFLTKTFHLN